MGEIKSLALIHGWGGDSRCWQPLLAQWQSVAGTFNGPFDGPFNGHIVTVDLPGFGARTNEPWPQTETLLAELEAQLPEDCLLLGWSLGGMLAVQLAERSKRVGSNKVRALVTIGANGRFVASDGWPAAMPETVFTDFCRAQREAPAKNMQRFAGLQARGDSEMRGLLKTLKAEVPAAVPQSWSQALECLGSLDNRKLLSAPVVPTLHLFGEGDALVPVQAASALEVLGASCKVIPQSGHCPHLSRPAQVAEIIRDFVGNSLGNSISSAVSNSAAPLEKTSVARAFGRAAASYDAAAHLQRAVCRELLSRAPEHRVPRRILDLGSGTGYGSELLRKRFPDAEIIALDIAPQMLQFARAHRPVSNAYVAADAEQLPLADGCIDLVFSSFALQWCYRLPQLFAEIRRVLAPAGDVLISTLLPGTLSELEVSWAAVDDAVHVNRFLPESDWHSACVANHLQTTTAVEQRVLHFDDVKSLMRELKSIGAHNVNREAGKGLLSRAKLRKLTEAYESERTDVGLPATYEVLYLQLAHSAAAASALDALDALAPG
ncbi:MULTISPECIES: malonyl-ACP O-methyltransferase BioC [Microbulbifer]|uniref:malonyl-ACP O-methyltransferase BioC n=1 Tax=Microbulbifer TaxID=48073 RepID=UPI001CD79C62|nr:malonyl-ACP O-methyltransferase BioC [Microbulbifer agarilyticus]MCA0900368.1 malonyl-ACP O-methyltransferase BioC [Microbulbifer agarilyticus]